jgi:F-type H+-transporting ATPase subunit b
MLPLLLTAQTIGGGGLPLCSWAAEPQAEVSTQHEVSASAATVGDHVASDGGHAPTGGDAHGAAAAGSPPITLDPDLAIVTAIIFLLLLAILGKFAWRPIVSAIDRREKAVADQLATALRNQEESKRLMAEHERRLSSAATEVKQLLDQARRDAESQKQQILESAQAAAAAEKDRAVREIHAAKNAALQDLAQRSVDTAVELAGNIVRRQLKPEDHAQLVGDALKQFSNER